MAYDNQESVFNMALAYLKRIDRLLYMCSMASMSGDIERWNTTLRAVYRELAIKLSSKEMEGLEGTELNVIDKNKKGVLISNVKQ